MNLDILKATRLIQGGMGAGVSNRRLARTVSSEGQAGVISGTGLLHVICRQLQLGDLDGAIRLAIDSFPIPEGQKWLSEYFVEGGKSPNKPFKSVPMIDHVPSLRTMELTIISCFTEVWLAKLDNDGLVGMNLLEKLQFPHLPSLFGGILGGVNFIVVGAGMPTQFPEVIERLSSFETAEYKLTVGNGDFTMRFNPADVMSKDEFLRLNVQKPMCLGIASTSTIAKWLHKQSGKRFDGFVVELPTAGGHNAPARGDELNARGEPIYDMEGRDNPHFDIIKDIGLPFWIAGGQSSPEALRLALELGATGVQLGTPFSLCRESGFLPEIKRRSIQEILAGSYDVFTDPKASPTGYPFKVAQREGTLSMLDVYQARDRICDLGYLRTIKRVVKETGEVDYVLSCPAEPVEDFTDKGGTEEETFGRKCICNALLAAIGLGQVRKNGYVELPIITSGDEVSFLKHIPICSDGLIGAKQVIDYMLGVAA